MKLMNLEFTRIGHDTFRIQGSKIIYTDPFRLAKADKADIVLLSHEHFDHLSLEDLKKVTSSGSTLVASVGCEAQLEKAKVTAKETKFLEPGGKLNIGEVEIEAVPAYNLNKFEPRARSSIPGRIRNWDSSSRWTGPASTLRAIRTSYRK